MFTRKQTYPLRFVLVVAAIGEKNTEDSAKVNKYYVSFERTRFVREKEA